MQYIIKNCPAYRAGMNLPHYCKAVGCCINTYVDGMDCTTISNCLLKKIIQTTNQKQVLDCIKRSVKAPFFVTKIHEVILKNWR